MEDLFVGLDWSPGQRAEARRMLAAQADGLMRAHRAEKKALQTRLVELRRSHADEKEAWHRANLDLTRKLEGHRTSDSPYSIPEILHHRFVGIICDGTFPEPPFYWPLVLKWRSLYIHDEALRQHLSVQLGMRDEVEFSERIVRAYSGMELALQHSANASTAAAESEDGLEWRDLDLVEQVLVYFGIPDFIIQQGMRIFRNSCASP